ncbi:MAG TPA: glycosyltransferase family 4 protein [Gemmatimonadales bacterium]|nr:glycosyltransferase family 4 protein [Gemmatimonadales bacterium]
MRRRLLYLFNDAPFFLSHRLPVARAAAAAGYEVHVATPPNAAAAAFGQYGLTHHPVALTRRGVNPVGEMMAVSAIVRLYRRLRPDLVEHATIKPVLYGGLVARVLRQPGVVSWMTGLGFVFISEGARVALLRRAVAAGYRTALHRPGSWVIFENPDDRDLFVARGLTDPSRTKLIRGAGVDMTLFHPTAEAPGVPIVVLPARMLRDKGVVEFVEAARALRSAGVVARFVLVGNADPANPAGLPEELLRTWNDEGSVEWWGQREDMADVLRGAHLVCLPSYREGLPKALVEAAASGRAIVATDAPGCREVVRHEWNGLLVPVRDAAALAESIGRLLRDPVERARMGARGRERVEDQFSDRHVIRETLAVYGEAGG